MEIVWHTGPRDELRALFELADDSPRALAAYLDLGRVLVARDRDGAVAGHLQLTPTADPGVVEIKSLAVRPDLQGRGLGRRLVERALAVARAEGAAEVTVTTAAADIGNLRFYQRCGFRFAAVERDAFTPALGYPPGLEVDGIPLRDAVRLGFDLAAADRC